MDIDRIRFMYDLFVGTMTRRNACPVCGILSNDIVGRKHTICFLRRCTNCSLLYRTPIDKIGFGAKYYQDDYHESMTTELPDKAQLEKYKSNRFINMGKNIDPIIDILEMAELENNSLVLDFGCSWGYSAWQFKTRGYHCKGYEISLPRAKYARDVLGIELVSHVEDLKGEIDLFFSSHVLEHVPNPLDTLSLAIDVVRPGGLVLFITPNGSFNYRTKAPNNWYSLWGRKHPFALDELFYQKHLVDHDYFITSTFLKDTVDKYIMNGGQSIENVDGPVLYCLIKRK